MRKLYGNNAQNNKGDRQGYHSIEYSFHHIGEDELNMRRTNELHNSNLPLAMMDRNFDRIIYGEYTHQTKENRKPPSHSLHAVFEVAKGFNAFTLIFLVLDFSDDAGENIFFQIAFQCFIVFAFFNGNRERRIKRVGFQRIDEFNKAVFILESFLEVEKSLIFGGILYIFDRRLIFQFLHKAFRLIRGEGVIHFNGQSKFFFDDIETLLYDNIHEYHQSNGKKHEAHNHHGGERKEAVPEEILECGFENTKHM